METPRRKDLEPDFCSTHASIIIVGQPTLSSPTYYRDRRLFIQDSFSLHLVYNKNDKPDAVHFNTNHIFQAYGAQAALGGPEKQSEAVTSILSQSSFTLSAIQSTTRLIEKYTSSLIFLRIQVPMKH
jgi:hypothetical protein